ncbi:protein of unknown function [Candidatus Promineifilum breve]|uniref:Uncharacterized protein n=1 Tax=Candidatus Promineifilum breve TaxID=1806508 RepID=A0A160T7R6_9CHLR|nr:hypothetical protein [Candidatus Promineifilum breve]CUS06042.1 protein of unknown function [Candidatus Promineifilum breve]
MNLLLHNESKHALRQPAGPTQPRVTPGLWHGDEMPTLPDSLFEELGYAGALEAADDEKAVDDDTFAGLFSLFMAPALSY